MSAPRSGIARVFFPGHSALTSPTYVGIKTSFEVNITEATNVGAKAQSNGNAHHGDLLDKGRVFGARAPGGIARERSACIHDRADNGQPDGSQRRNPIRETRRQGQRV